MIEMTFYTAEQESGDIFLVASFPTLDKDGFLEMVRRYLERSFLPNEDQNIQRLDLCEWTARQFADWLGEVPPAGESWASMFARARYGELVWTYPGSWKTERVRPWLVYDHEHDVDAYAPDDPKSEGYHDRVVQLWDARERG